MNSYKILKKCIDLLSYIMNIRQKMLLFFNIDFNFGKKYYFSKDYIFCKICQKKKVFGDISKIKIELDYKYMVF